MKKSFMVFFVGMFVAILSMPLVSAEEVSSEQPMEAAQVESQEVAAPEAVEVAEPIETAEIETAPAVMLEGTVSKIDLEAEEPFIHVKKADGTEEMVYVDFDLTLVSKADEELFLEDLALEQKVKVALMEGEEKKLADTIEIA
jgi:hypothetical protein